MDIFMMMDLVLISIVTEFVVVIHYQIIVEFVTEVIQENKITHILVI